MANLKFNGKTFLKFSSKETPKNGYYKAYKYKVMFYDNNKEVQACLVNNRYGEKFFVTAFKSKADGGKTRYMHSTMTKTEKFLGIEHLPYTRQYDLANEILNQLNNQG